MTSKNKVISIHKNKSVEEKEHEISIMRLGYDMDSPDSMINYIRNLTMQRLKELNISTANDLGIDKENIIADHNIMIGALRTYIQILEEEKESKK